MYAENTVLVVGQAKPSREDAIYNLHGEFYISLVVESGVHVRGEKPED